jgi:hypothetical protein
MRTLINCIALVLLFWAAPELVAQPSMPLSDSLSSFTAQTLHLVPGDRERLLPLSTPLTLPSVLLANVGSTKALVPLWSVPTVSPENRAVLGKKLISEQLKDYFDKEGSFTLGERTLDDDAKKRLSKALSILYKDPDTRSMPTKNYERYRQWQDKRAELLKAIQAAATAADKISLNQKLIDEDQDYAILGQKEQIETAIEVLTKSTSDAPSFQAQFKKIRELATPEQDVISHGQFLKRVGSPSAWVRIATTVESAKLPVNVEVTIIAEGGVQQSFVVPTVWISYQAIHVRLDQPLLTADILGNRAWKRRDGRVLSNGAVGMENPGSIPNFVSSVLVIRDLEIEFDVKSEPYEKFATALGDAAKATIGNVPVDFRGPGAAYLLPGRLYSPRPVAIAAIIAVPARLPNPVDDLVWK